ncbi:hypothetical protein FRC09_004902 [Ceratobasidium sp. 395]|nr:hypothetical protein FRC09_004902 [Ceratobasidium sp. 395]
MPVYFAIQTINADLKAMLPIDLKHVTGPAFLIKVGASHTKKSVISREKTYRLNQKKEDVTFIPNVELPFKAAEWIQEGTFKLLQSDKLKLVSGTNETYLVNHEGVQVEKLRDALKKPLEVWGDVPAEKEGLKAVCNYLQYALLPVFVNFGLADPDMPSRGVEELTKVSAQFDEAMEKKPGEDYPEEDEVPWKR